MRRNLCDHCQRPLNVCFCHLIKPIKNQWPVTLIQHVQESHLAIGTAKIAQLSLQAVQTIIVQDNESLLSFDDSESAILVYPGQDSLSLKELQNLPPKRLVFIDASWRKSKKIFFQSSLLQALPSVSFKFPEPSRYRIRKQPQAGYCSTLEAIALVLETLESSPESAPESTTDKYHHLLAVMDWMINQQIAYRDGNSNKAP